LGLSGSIEYHCSDGCFMEKTPDNSADFGFSCPPYYDLEQYSDLPNDLSNLPDYETFDKAMSNCAKAYFRTMKPGAFVCITVGNFRQGGNKDENELVNFEGDTISNFRRAGFLYWQNIILSKNFSSAAVRSTTSWKGQKLIPRHEYLLVFRKPQEVIK